MKEKLKYKSTEVELRERRL